MELYEGICHDVDDDRLLKLLQDKSVEMNMSLKDVMWMYINRGIFKDRLGDDFMFKFHSDEHMDKLDKILGLD